MSLVSCKGLLHVPNPITNVDGIAGTTLDATGERCGQVLMISKTGNIRNVWIRTGTVTKGDDLKISLQGVNSSGLPDGTIKGTGNAGYVVATINDSDDNKWAGPFQLGVDVAVTQGETISLVVEWNSYTDGSLIIQLVSPILDKYNCYQVTDITATPGTWLKSSTSHQCIALEYDDGTYMVGNIGAIYLGGGTVNVNSTPDEYGNLFQMPFPCRVIGFWIYANLYYYDAVLTLYDASSKILANATIEADYRHGASPGYLEVFFDSDPAANVTLAKDTNYRMVVASTSSDSISFRDLSVPEAAAMEVMDLGTSCYMTYRTDGGTWTESTTRRVCMGLILDQLDNGVGSGGGLLTHPGMAGGCRG